jgi:HSP20 family protein
MYGFGFDHDGFWDLYREMDRVRDAFRPAPEAPALNVWAGDKDAVVTAEVPGLDPKDLDISVVGDTLTLRMSLPEPEAREGETWHRQERPFGTFARTLRLPFQVDAGRVGARLNNGVLQVTLPRAEEDKARKIAIQAE